MQYFRQLLLGMLRKIALHHPVVVAAFHPQHIFYHFAFMLTKIENDFAFLHNHAAGKVYNFIITHNPMLALIPGFAIMLLVLAFNLLGNGLRDAVDVKND